MNNPQVIELKQEECTRKLLSARRELQRDVAKAVENFQNRIGVRVTNLNVLNSGDNNLPVIVPSFM